MNNSEFFYCPQCGFKNKLDARYCSNCGQDLNNNNVSNNNQVANQLGNGINSQESNNQSNLEDKKNGDMLGVISLVLYLGGSTIFSALGAFFPESISSFFSSLGGLSGLAGIVLMIVGRIKYPNNKFLKVVMWIIISLIAILFIATIVFMIACFITCSSYSGSSCG